MGRSGTGGNEETSMDHGSDVDHDDTAAVNNSVRIGMKKNFDQKEEIFPLEKSFRNLHSFIHCFTLCTYYPCKPM